MQLPRPRGPFSEHLFAQLAAPDPTTTPFDQTGDVLSDDVQIGLWALYELSYRGFEKVADDHEWSPALLATRAQVEAVFEETIRELTAPAVDRAIGDHGQVPEQLAAVIEDVEDAGLASFLQRQATEDQYREFLMH